MWSYATSSTRSGRSGVNDRSLPALQRDTAPGIRSPAGFSQPAHGCASASGVPGSTTSGASSATSAARRAAGNDAATPTNWSCRASSYSPYLGADLEGTGSTSFEVSFAAPERAAARARELTPRWGPISAALAVLLLLLSGGVVLWRRS